MKKRYPIHRLLSLVLVALFLLNMVPNVAFASLRSRGEGTKAEQNIEVGEVKELKAYLEKVPVQNSTDPTDPTDPADPAEPAESRVEYYVRLMLNGTLLAEETLNGATVYWDDAKDAQPVANGYATENEKVEAKVHYDGLILSLTQEHTEDMALTVTLDEIENVNVFVGGDTDIKVNANVTFENAAKSLLGKASDDQITVNAADGKVSVPADVEAKVYDAVVYVQGNNSETVYAKQTFQITARDGVVYQIDDGKNTKVYTNKDTIKVTATVYDNSATLDDITLFRGSTEVRTEQFDRQYQTVDEAKVYTKNFELKTSEDGALAEDEYVLRVGGLERTVVVDRTGPVVKLTAPVWQDGIDEQNKIIYLKTDEDGKVAIQATITDDHLDENDNTEATRTVENTYADGAVNGVDLTVWKELTDRLGNKASKIIYVAEGGTEYTLQPAQAGQTIYQLKVDRLAPYSEKKDGSYKIVLNTEPERKYFNQETIRVTGKIVDDGVGVGEVTYSVSGTGVKSTVNGDVVTLGNNGSFIISIDTVENTVGEATVVVTAKDKAGNVRDSEKLTLKIDRIRPTVEITLPKDVENNDPAKTIDGVDYYQTEQTIVIAVTDDCFDDEASSGFVTLSNGKEVNFPTVNGPTWVPDGENPNRYTLTLTVSDDENADILTVEDGNGIAVEQVTVGVVDKAGNSATAMPTYKFTVDTQSPTLTIETDCDFFRVDGDDRLFLKPTTLETEGAESTDTLGIDPDSLKVVLTLEINDANFDIDALAKQDNFGKDDKGNITYTATCKPGEVTEIRLPKIEDSTGHLLQKASLRAGKTDSSVPGSLPQEGSLSVTNGVVETFYVDLQTPTFVEQPEGDTTVTVKDKSEGIINNIHTGDLKFEVQVTDGTGAGIKSVEFMSDSNAVAEEIRGKYQEAKKAEFSEAYPMALETVDGVEDNEGQLWIQVTDNAGNIRTYVYSPIQIDRKAPVVEITLPKNTENAQNTVYFNEVQEIVITATDINFDPDNSTVEVTLGEGDKARTEKFPNDDESSPTWKQTEGKLSEYTLTLTVSDEDADIITVGEDGTGLAVTKVTVNATDLAKNAKDYEETCNFIVDTVDPTLIITAENCDAFQYNGKVFLVPNEGTHAEGEDSDADELIPAANEFAVKLTLNVTDANFDPNTLASQDAHITVSDGVAVYTVSCKPGEITPIELPAFIDLAGRALSEAKVNPSKQDGENSTAPHIEELSVNKETGVVETLYVDLQTPHVEANQPVVTDQSDKIVSDIHTGDLKYEVKLTDGDGTGIQQVQFKTSASNAVEKGFHEYQTITANKDAAGTYTMAITTVDGQEDNDVYLYFRVTDEAGNVRTYKYGPIKVDRKAPVVEITLPTEPDKTFEKVDYYKTNQKIVVAASDINFDRASIVKVTMADGTFKEFSGENRWKTNGDQYVMTLTVSDKNADIIAAKDGKGLAVTKVTVNAKDLAENAKKYEETTNFIVDTTAPVIKITLPGDSFNHTAAAHYYTEDQQIVVTVTDRNLDTANSIVTVTMSDESTKEFSGGSWKTNGDQNVMTLSVSDQKGDNILTIKGNEGLAVAKVAVNAKDLATNEKTDAKACGFIVDTIRPTISASFSNNVKGVFYREADNTRTYYIIPKTPINDQNRDTQPAVEEYSITLTASDANFAMNGVENNKKLNLRFISDGDEKWTKTGEGTYSVTKTISVEKDRIGVLEFKMNVIDMVGLVPENGFVTVGNGKDSVSSALALAFNADNGESSMDVRIDRRQSSSNETLDMPEIEIVPNVEAVNHAYNHDNVALFDAKLKNFTLDVFDQYNQGAAETASNAGIGTVTWKLADETGYVNAASREIKAGTIENDELKEWQTAIHDSIPVNRNGSGETNGAVITVAVKDNAGNEIGMQDFCFGLDTLAPRVTVTYNDEAAPVHNGKYFKETRVATVRVEDINFDPSDAALCVADTQVPGSGWTANGNNTFTRTFTYAADGDYTFAVETKDMAGNVQRDSGVTYVGAAPQEFTVDKTAPVITVVYDNNSVLNGRYYKNDRTATITILEHNFNQAIDLSTPITANLNGSPIAIPAVSAFSEGGDFHAAYVTFHNDGDYTLGVQYTDLAGNMAVAYEGDLFTIDQTKPEIVISGVENINVATVSPIVTFSDNNFDVNNYATELLFSRMLKAPEVVDPGKWEDNKSGKGVTVTISDVSYEKLSDGIYELTAKATDLAGNEADIKTITYSVNRFGSTYYTEDPTTLSLLDGFSKEALPLQVVEVNPNQLTNQSITLSVNGQTITLREGQDYTATPTGNDATGYRYTYNIKASAFEEDGALREGAYVMTFFSEDAAGNANSNRSNVTVDETGNENLLDINFTLDNTVPLVSITGIENGERITADQRDVVVYFSDGSEVAKVVINVNGEEIVLEGDELAALNGQYTVHLTESKVDQIISATVYDAAGNVIESGNYSVYLNSNILRQFVHRRGLFFGSLAGVLAAGTGGFFLVAKKKKDKDEDEAK